MAIAAAFGPSAHSQPPKIRYHHGMSTSHDRRLAVVTGGGSGLGREFCQQLARQGWHVVVADIDLAAAQQTLAELEQADGAGEACQLDVTDFAAWQALVAQLRGGWPRLDLLVNNAGICAAGKIGEAPLADFHKVAQVNLFGVLNGCQATAPWLRETAPGGAIVNIASVAAVLSAPTMAAYNVSKAGVVALSETLYCELLPLGIHVTVVLPGFFRSRLIERGHFADELFRRLAEGYTEASKITPAEVVRRTLRGVERRQLYVAWGWRVRAIWKLKRMAPTWLLRRVARRFAAVPASPASHTET